MNNESSQSVTCTTMNFLVLISTILLPGVKGLINGRTAHIYEFPYIAVICSHEWPVSGAVILDEKRVLVAAGHIGTTRPEALMVIVESMEFGHCNGVGIPVESVRVHLDCVADLHDLAVIKLAGSIEFNSNVQPVGIGLSPDNPCTMCRLLGYKRLGDDDFLDILGQESDLAWSNAVLVDRDVCTQMGVDVGETEVCFRDPFFEAMVTVTDHGFPVICQGAVVGLIITLDESHRPRNAMHPGVMVNLTYYIDWIYEN